MGIVVGGDTYVMVGAGGQYPHRGPYVEVYDVGARGAGGAGGTAAYAP